MTAPEHSEVSTGLLTHLKTQSRKKGSEEAKLDVFVLKSVCVFSVQGSRAGLCRWVKSVLNPTMAEFVNPFVCTCL